MKIENIKINHDDFVTILSENPELQLIDVRDYTEEPMLEILQWPLSAIQEFDSKNIPLELNPRIKTVTICKSGQRSLYAALILIQCYNFNEVVSLEEGISSTKNWEIIQGLRKEFITKDSK